jgi:hypothetical protein
VRAQFARSLDREAGHACSFHHRRLPRCRGGHSPPSSAHGRGDPPSDWKNHSARVKGSEFFWVSIIGPDTPALGERQNIDPVGQDQVAGTMAALLGFDYRADVPRAGKVLPDAVR